MKFSAIILIKFLTAGLLLFSLFACDSSSNNGSSSDNANSKPSLNVTAELPNDGGIKVQCQLSATLSLDANNTPYAMNLSNDFAKVSLADLGVGVANVLIKFQCAQNTQLIDIASASKSINFSSTAVDLNFSNSDYNFPDSDGDGTSNLKELLAGTNPLMPAPNAPLVSVDTALKRFVLQWDAVTGAEQYKVYLNVDSNSGFDLIGTTALTSYQDEVSLHLIDPQRRRYIVEACNSDGCSASDMVDVEEIMPGAIGYVKASDTTGGSQFSVVALSGDGETLAVGAAGKYYVTAPAVGAVYIYHKDADGEWRLQDTLVSEHPGAFDLFGSALDLSMDGNILAVGAPGEDSPTQTINGDQAASGAVRSGAVFIFERNNGTWQQTSYIKAGNAQADDNFGYAVSLSDDANWLAVGAPFEDAGGTNMNVIPADNTVDGSGAVYLYSRSTNNTWRHHAYIKAATIGNGDEFGFEVSLSGDGSKLAVGAVLDADNSVANAPNSGSVTTYQRQADRTWILSDYIIAQLPQYDVYFGGSLAFNQNGSTLAVGSFLSHSTHDSSRIGAVYVYQADASNSLKYSTRIEAPAAEDGDEFGYSISMNATGDLLVVGATKEDSWVVGLGSQPGNNDALDAGAAFLFENKQGNWQLRSYIKSLNTDPEDHFGLVSLSASGEVLAVGARDEDSNATYINGDFMNNDYFNSGAVYLY